MVILNGQGRHGNVLHVAIGEETECWMDLHGAAVADIAPLLRTMDLTKPVNLHITRCASEVAVAASVQASMSTGQHYPFHPSTYMFVSRKHATPGLYTMDTGTKTGTCDACGHADKELVPGLTTPLCFECLSLNAKVNAIRSKSVDAPELDNTTKPTGKGRPRTK